MIKSEFVDKILPKIFKVKGSMTGVTKDASNPFFKSKYADLNSHLDMIEPLLQEAGLVLIQPVENNAELNTVSSYIFDKDSGQYVGSSISISGKDMQALGAAVTYGRRFTLGALFGMQAVDDDGNLASGKEVKKETSFSKTMAQELTPAKTQPILPGVTPINNPAPSFRKKPAAPAVKQSSGDDL